MDRFRARIKLDSDEMMLLWLMIYECINSNDHSVQGIMLKSIMDELRNKFKPSPPPDKHHSRTLKIHQWYAFEIILNAYQCEEGWAQAAQVSVLEKIRQVLMNDRQQQLNHAYQ